MAGKHRYEPEVYRSTWVPADDNADPLRVEHLNTGLNEVMPPAKQSFWSKLRPAKKS